VSASAVYIIAASVGSPALISSVWVGVLFHRVLSLPPNKRKHGLDVLDKLPGRPRVVGRHRMSAGNTVYARASTTRAALMATAKREAQVQNASDEPQQL
jgi:hypothetical protein